MIYDADTMDKWLTKHVLSLMDYEDWLLRGVGNTVMLIEHMTATGGYESEVKWNSTVELHKQHIMEAWAINLERRFLYQEIRDLHETPV